jgi:hypothetical protein
VRTEIRVVGTKRTDQESTWPSRKKAGNLATRMSAMKPLSTEFDISMYSYLGSRV